MKTGAEQEINREMPKLEKEFNMYERISPRRVSRLCLEGYIMSGQYIGVGSNDAKQRLFRGRNEYTNELEYISSDEPQFAPQDLLEALRMRYAYDALWTSQDGIARFPRELESTHIHNILNKLRGMHETFIQQQRHHYLNQDLTFESVYPLAKRLQEELDSRRKSPIIPEPFAELRNEIVSMFQAAGLIEISDGPRGRWCWKHPALSSYRIMLETTFNRWEQAQPSDVRIHIEMAPRPARHCEIKLSVSEVRSRVEAMRLVSDLVESSAKLIQRWRERTI